MGILGWNVLGADVELVGIVDHVSLNVGFFFGDGDWSVIVVPDPAYQALLLNGSGTPNDDGMIECEVRPPAVRLSPDEPTLNNIPDFINGLVGKRVRIRGWWVEDISHQHKTEIHPIASIVAETAYPFGYEVMVFSDGSPSASLFAPRPAPPGARTRVEVLLRLGTGNPPAECLLPDANMVGLVQARSTFDLTAVQDDAGTGLLLHVVCDATTQAELTEPWTWGAEVTNDGGAIFRCQVFPTYPSTLGYLYAGVMMPGTGAQELDGFVQYDDFASMIDNYAKNGFACTAFDSGWASSEQRQYVGVFTELASVEPRLSQPTRVDDLPGMEALFLASGYVPVGVDLFADGPNLRVVVLWHKTPGTGAVRWGGLDAFREHIQEQEKAGLRLVALDAVVLHSAFGTEVVYVGAFRDGSWYQVVHLHDLELDRDDFAAGVTALAANGIVPIAMKTLILHAEGIQPTAQRRFVTVYRDAAGGPAGGGAVDVWISTGLVLQASDVPLYRSFWPFTDTFPDDQDFADEANAQFAAGKRLVALELHNVCGLLGPDPRGVATDPMPF